MYFFSMISVAIISVVLSDRRIELPDNPMLEEPDVNIIWHWEDRFNPEETLKVESWLNSVTNAVESTLGTYPFDLHYFIYRRGGSREPVPWANTRRYNRQGVNFHIDPSYSLESFLADWTAPHEISHLSIPYLGSSNAWFAEGYASFLQYQVMEEMGIYSPEEVKNRYQSKLAMALPYFIGEQDMVTIARSLQKRHLYPQMYWGGASFFVRLDQNLKKEYNTSLSELIKAYQACCRLEDQSIEEVINSWDRLLGTSACSDLLRTYQFAPASVVSEME